MGLWAGAGPKCKGADLRSSSIGFLNTSSVVRSLQWGHASLTLSTCSHLVPLLVISPMPREIFNATYAFSLMLVSGLLYSPLDFLALWKWFLFPALHSDGESLSERERQNKNNTNIIRHFTFIHFVKFWILIYLLCILVKFYFFACTMNLILCRSNLYFVLLPAYLLSRERKQNSK